MGEQESMACFKSSWVSEFAFPLLKLEGVFLRSGSAVSKASVLCSTVAFTVRCLCRGPQGHTDTKMQIQRNTKKPRSASS